jgi:hypothetical protein
MHHIYLKNKQKLKNKMRQLLFIFSVIIFWSCNSRGHENYNKINSRYIKTSFLVDSKGAILDTFPSWLKIIKNYSITNIDTSKIFLPDSKIALDFARLIIDPIYGKSQMDSEKPFNIDLIDNKFWFITGTFPKEHTKGGVVEILISKYDCRILYLTHGK